MADHWQILFACILFVLITQIHSQDNDEVPITLVHCAEQKGAVCIDGSPGGYLHAVGSGDGANNWIVFLMGGGWCGSHCRDRLGKDRDLGSTKNITSSHLEGILSSNQSTNPDFYNWNRVFVRYCDGSCFTGDNEVYDAKVGMNLQLRGSRIFSAVMDELLEKGMKNANNAILMGASAGGLSTMLHCDGFRALIPNAGRVKCISDSGFFIRGKDISGAEFRQWEYRDVIQVHNLSTFLPASCTSRMDPSLCLFSEYLIGDIKTPLFLLNSAIDSFEIQWALKPDVATKAGWENCTESPNATTCTPAQIQLIKDFRNAYLETFKGIANKPSTGFFINSCFHHIYTLETRTWNSNGSPKLENKTIAQAIGDWYFDRNVVRLMDTQNDIPLNCGVNV